MDPQKWRRIRDAFEAIVGAPREQRSRLIEDACGGDQELRDDIERLLAAHDRSGGLAPGLSETRFTLPSVAFGPSLQRGELVAGRFEIIDLVGSGGMGEVYAARDATLRETIALKTLRVERSRDPEFLARFRREIRLARLVSHPNICRVHDIHTYKRSDSEPEIDLIAMELIEGQTLAERIGSEGAIGLEEARPLIQQMASGLQALHEAGIVHRDFKPGNVMICGGATPRAVITDFGLARPVLGGPEAGSSITVSNQLLGTPAYMPPEQLRGESTGPWTDVYAFGVVICEMLTGVNPFRADSGVGKPSRRTTEIIARLPSKAALPVRKALAALPDDRPKTPVELALAVVGKRSIGWRFVVLAASAALAMALLGFGTRFKGQELGSMTAAILPDEACHWFPGASWACQLPDDRDIAYIPLTVEAETEEDRALGVGLSRFLGDSLYRVRANKHEFCFHVRDDHPEVGVPLTLVGKASITDSRISLELLLERNEDDLVLRRSRLDIERLTSEGAHLEIVAEAAEAVGYALDQSAVADWVDSGPRDESAFEDYLAGLGHWQLGELELAAERLRAALNGPKGGLAFTAASIALGGVQRQLYAETSDERFVARAERAFRQASVVPSTDLHRSWGLLEQVRSNHTAALEHYRRAFEIDPFDYMSISQLVNSYEALGDRDRVTRLLDAAAAAQPNCWRIRNLVAKKQMQYGDYKESEKSLLRVIQLAPRHPVAYNNLAVVYLNEGRYDEAIGWASRTLDLGQTGRYAVTLGVGYLYRGCVEQARAIFRKLVEREPNYLFGWRRLAQASYLASGMSSETKGALTRLLEISRTELTDRPYDVDTRCAAASALALLGQQQAAHKAIGDLENLAPETDATALCAGEVHELTGNRDKALENLSLALQRGATLHKIEQAPFLADLRNSPVFIRWLEELDLDRPVSQVSQQPCSAMPAADMALQPTN